MISCCIILYGMVLFWIILYDIVLYCTVLYYIAWYCTVLYCIVLCCIVLYCIVLYQIHYVVLYYIILYYFVLLYIMNIIFPKLKDACRLLYRNFILEIRVQGFNPLITISITLMTNVHTECIMMPFLWLRDGIG